MGCARVDEPRPALARPFLLPPFPYLGAGIRVRPDVPDEATRGGSFALRAEGLAPLPESPEASKAKG